MQSPKLSLPKQSVMLPTKYGNFDLDLIENPLEPVMPHTVIKTIKDPECRTPLVRIHSECLTGDVFGSLRCDCGPQLDAYMRQMALEHHAYLFYLRQEGRGIGLAAKMQAYLLQEKGFDTAKANTKLGLPEDARTYEMVAKYLLDRGFERVILMTNNPLKAKALEDHGLKVGMVPLEIEPNEFNAQYLRTKRDYFNHALSRVD